MKILLSWLREFVPFTQEPRELAKDLSALGFAVDAVNAAGDDTVLDIDVTTNRPDCLSHYGIARELAAKYELPLAPFDSSSIASLGKRPRPRRKDAMVEILATELCARYSARLIRNVRVGPSPEWLVKRLELLGLRSINNVADATNYVLMAYGHPMHAFDLDKLEGARIVVRHAEQGEAITTLDGVERRLTPEDLVIADARRAVALAGVMGGQDSEISSATRNVLLESAWFDPVAIRRTAKRQGLHTEASHRFERGADIEATVSCATRCIELVHELAGGDLQQEIVDAYAKPLSRPPIMLRHSELSRHLGLAIPLEEAEAILTRLGFSPRPRGRTAWTCQAPSYRVDISRDIDLIEEVARQYGYDRFPLRLPASAGTPARRAPNAENEERVRGTLLALGYDEAISSPMVGRDTEEFAPGPLVELPNPLSEQTAVLRTSMVPSLLTALQWNAHRGQRSVSLFEIGKTYRRNHEGFVETPTAALATIGERSLTATESPWREITSPSGFYDLKRDIEVILEPFGDTQAQARPNELPAYYRPGHAARVMLNGDVAAQLGELSPKLAEAWKFRGSVFLAEIFLPVLYARGLRIPHVNAVSKYPAVERDFSVVLREEITYEAVRGSILSLGIPELADIRPVEVFRGGPVPPGHYSLLLRLTLQSSESTFTEADLADRSSRVIAALEQSLGATIRMSG